MRKKWFNLHAFNITIIIFLIIALASFIYLNIHFLDPLGHSLKDYEVTDIVYSQFRDNEVKLEDRIVLVNIGNPDRTQISSMLDRILAANPRVIGLDVFLSDEKEALSDSMLQASIKRGEDKIVLATALQDYDEDLGIFKIVSVDDSMFSNYARVGFANFPANPTKTIRYFSSSELGPNGPVRSFATEIAHVYDSTKVNQLFKRANTLERIHFTSTEGDFIKFEPESILDTAIDLRPLLENKIILMGYSGSNEWNDPLIDKHFTPLNDRYTGRSTPDMYGFVIHANIIQMILDNQYIGKVPAWLSFLLAFILCYFNIILLIWISHRYHSVYHPIARVLQILQFAILFFIIAYLYYFYRLKWDFTLGLLGLALAVDTQVIYISLIEHYKPNFKLFSQKGSKHSA
jgi:CHASE2 domain-containing sensor protein